jgi:hypothetical protein
MKDNLVSGTVVAEPPLAAAGVLANGGWSGASLGPCRLMTFAFFDQRRLPSEAEPLMRAIEVAMARLELRL